MGEIRVELEILKEAAARHRGHRREVGRMLRWPEELKRRVSVLLGQGMTAGSLASVLGIERALIRGWRRRYGASVDHSPQFIELGIVPVRQQRASSPTTTSPNNELLLTGPRGTTIRGLGIEQVAALLRAELL